MLNINNAVVSHLELDTLVKTISASLLDILPYEAAGIAFYDAERNLLSEFVNIGYSGFDGYQQGEIYPLKEHLPRWYSHRVHLC